MSRWVTRATRFAAIALVAVGLTSLSMPSAASTATVPTRHLTARGGTVKWTATVDNAKWCTWWSSPRVPKFNASVRCEAGTVSRSAKLKPNTSTKVKNYAFKLMVLGNAKTVLWLKVVEAGKTTSTTRTTATTTTTTTTTLPPPPFTGGSSRNWSGYVLTGGSGGYQAIGGEWRVPTLDCTSVPDGITSDWVGVNGFGDENPGLFQDGTSSGCVSGQQSNFAWWTDEAENDLGVELFAVAPGDLIDAEVYQETSGYWAYYIKDLTSGSSSSAVESFSGPGTSAEWIAEDPGDPNTHGLYALANFGSVTFTDLRLAVPSGSWTLPPYSDAIEMVRPDGWVEALPSLIQGSGASATFTVTYEPPGDVASTAGTAAVQHPQTTFVSPVHINIPILPQHRAGQPGSRSIPGPGLGAGSH